MQGWTTVVAFGCVLGSGLMAGLFFAFSSFVMRALAGLPPAQGVAAMQSLNATILTPLFALVFLGTAVASAVLAAHALWSWRAASAPLLAGSALYLVGVIAVTMAFNVPRNEALAAVDPVGVEAARLWSRYVPEWTAWNHVRTVASIGALISFVIALRR